MAFPDFEDIQAKLVLRPFTDHVVQITGMVNLDRINVQNLEKTGQQDSSTVSPIGNEAAYNELLGATWSFAAGERLHAAFYGNWYRNHGDSGFSGRLEPRENARGGIFGPGGELGQPLVFGGGDVMEFSMSAATSLCARPLVPGGC